MYAYIDGRGLLFVAMIYSLVLRNEYYVFESVEVIKILKIRRAESDQKRVLKIRNFLKNQKMWQPCLVVNVVCMR